MAEAKAEVEAAHIAADAAHARCKRLYTQLGKFDPMTFLKEWADGVEKKYDYGQNFPDSVRKRREAIHERALEARAKAHEAKDAMSDAMQAVLEAEGELEVKSFLLQQQERTRRTAEESDRRVAETRAAADKAWMDYAMLQGGKCARRAIIERLARR